MDDILLQISKMNGQPISLEIGIKLFEAELQKPHSETLLDLGLIPWLQLKGYQVVLAKC